EPAPTSTSEAGRTEISALRERIAEYRRTRGPDGEGSELSPRLPLQDEPAQRRQVSNFGFAADAAGRIEWAESEVASSVIGTRLIAPRRIGTSGDETAFERAYSRRQPIRRAEVELTGASRIAGIWVVDAQPQFTEDGNFSGYVGRFRKPVSGEGMAYGPSAREADRIRQLLHELRTPVTAIQGYAEVVQQQLFGPAPHEYRAMSASIAADAARILSGFEELDRLARLEAGVAEMEAGASDLADISRKIAAQLAPVLAPRLAGIEIEPPQGDPVVIALANGEAEALIWRVLATFGGGCASGEVLTCALGRERNMARLSCEVPAQLLSENDIFAADAKPIASNINAGLFGAGFTLRLARAEARAAGGNLAQDGERMTLLLPMSTTANAFDSSDLDEGIGDKG
ncbi:MAG: histidine kinase dimerization/phospho-acceptor domain-containing protein, partial [Pseudomonadota bacterium]